MGYKDLLSKEVQEKALKIMDEGFLEKLCSDFDYYETDVNKEVENVVDGLDISTGGDSRKWHETPVKIYSEKLPYEMHDGHGEYDSQEWPTDIVVMDNGRVYAYANLVQYEMGDAAFGGTDRKEFKNMQDFSDSLVNAKDVENHEAPWQERKVFAETIQKIQPILEQYKMFGGPTNEELKLEVLKENPRLYQFLNTDEKTTQATIEAVARDLELFDYVPDEDSMPEFEDTEVLKDKIVDKAEQLLQQESQTRDMSIEQVYEEKYAQVASCSDNVWDMVEDLESRCNSDLDSHDRSTHNFDEH